MNRFPDDDDSSDGTEAPAERSGRVQFDDRGNAVWQPGRRRRLDHPSLSLAEDEPAPLNGAHDNPSGLKSGYDPYTSGLLKGGKKEEFRKRTDLRALSKWIQLKKNLGDRGTD